MLSSDISCVLIGAACAMLASGRLARAAIVDVLAEISARARAMRSVAIGWVLVAMDCHALLTATRPRMHRARPVPMAVNG